MRKLNMLAVGVFCCVSIVFGATAVPARAADFPTKPIRLIIPYPPGGPTDAAARFVALGIEEKLGQPVAAENRPGASGIIALDLVAKAQPDGYTLALAASPMASYQALIKSYSANLVDRLTPVALAVTAESVIVVPNDLPVKSLGEFAAYAKANPGKLNYGTAGLSWTILMHREIERKYGIVMSHIPYQGSTDAQTALLRGDIHMYIGGVIPFLPLVKQGRIKIITFLTPERNKLFPEVQNIAEAGFDDFKSVDPIWYGVMAPRNTPSDVIAKLSEAINSKFQAPDTKEQLAKLGLIATGSTPEAFSKRVAYDAKYWSDVAKRVGFEPQ